MNAGSYCRKIIQGSSENHLRKGPRNRGNGDDAADAADVAVAAARQGMTAKPNDNLAAWLRKAMDEHEGALLRYAGRILGDAERGRDVVQDTFLRLLESGRDLDGGRLAQWLFTVCRNRCLDVFRKERRMTLMSEHVERSAAGSELAPDDAASGREQAGRVSAAMSALPPSQQEVLRLRFQNGFSYKRIAGITGLTVTNVGFLIHTGIQRLRRRFQVDGQSGREREAR
jgi:RNA polymerase sigma-70 factor (ECF subfamily)